jgi:hypothetical protein
VTVIMAASTGQAASAETALDPQFPVAYSATFNGSYTEQAPPASGPVSWSGTSSSDIISGGCALNSMECVLAGSANGNFSADLDGPDLLDPSDSLPCHQQDSEPIVTNSVGEPFGLNTPGLLVSFETGVISLALAIGGPNGDGGSCGFGPYHFVQGMVNNGALWPAPGTASSTYGLADFFDAGSTGTITFNWTWPGTCAATSAVGGGAHSTADQARTTSGPSFATGGAERATAAVSVTFPAIKNEDTPPNMNDRVPPRVRTEIGIVVKTTCDPVRIQVQADDPSQDGTVKINGADSVLEDDGSPTIDLVGGDQTKPGRGPHLRLVAIDTATNQMVGQSAPFAVSAIPIKWTEELAGRFTGDHRGIRTNATWDSDSGEIGDLNQVQWAEVIHTNYSTWPLVTAVDGFERADIGHTADFHNLGTAALKAIPNKKWPYKSKLLVERLQAHVFIDLRSTVLTDPTDPTEVCTENNVFPITDSGYTISHTMSRKPTRITSKRSKQPRVFTTTKQPDRVTIDGVILKTEAGHAPVECPDFDVSVTTGPGHTGPQDAPLVLKQLLGTGAAI